MDGACTARARGKRNTALNADELIGSSGQYKRWNNTNQHTPPVSDVLAGSLSRPGGAVNIITQEENTMRLEDLPRRWQHEIKELRAENARLRVQRRELRLQLDELTEARSNAE